RAATATRAAGAGGAAPARGTGGAAATAGAGGAAATAGAGGAGRSACARSAAAPGGAALIAGASTPTPRAGASGPTPGGIGPTTRTSRARAGARAPAEIVATDSGDVSTGATAAKTVVRRPRSRRSPDLPDAPRDHGKRQQARDPACARDPGCG